MTAIILSITLGTLSATDRPAMTEGTEAVLPNTVQLETDVFSLQYSYNKSIVNIGNMLLKTGVFKNSDIHLGWSGITDNSFVLRLRKSFSFSESKRLAVIPYTVFTLRDINGFGVAIPFSFQVSDRISVASMYNVEVSKENAVFHFNTLSFGFTLIPNVSAFTEGAVKWLWTGSGYTYEALFINSGFVWNVRQWIQLDVGTYFNVLSKEYAVFIGMSFNVSLSDETNE